MPNKQLIEFYLGMDSYPNGSTLKEIITEWSDEQLETCHDYIQWLFPTVQKSQFNSNAPLLDEDTINGWKESAVLSRVLLEALDRMCAFYGLQVVKNVSPPQIVRAGHYAERKSNWQDAEPGYLNHNLLRLTRIIDSLVTLGQPQYGAALYRCLEVIAQEEPEKIPERTVMFWRKAVIRPFELTPTRQMEREVFNSPVRCPEQANRLLWSAENAKMLYEKRRHAFRALGVIDLLGDSEVTEDNLKLLRRTLTFISQECAFAGHDVNDIIQQVQTKLTPGYEMATDMFEALNTEACRYQLLQSVGYGFALECALRALRAQIRLDVKRQIAGSDNKSGIRQSLLLLAQVYERVNDSKRASELRAVADKIDK